MKLAYRIFSIYLIILSCLPCADMATAVSDCISQVISSKLDNHSHENNGDTCSPFCVCNCCGNHSFICQMNFHIVENITEIKIKLPEYQTLLASTYFGSIWQPPQINDVV